MLFIDKNPIKKTIGFVLQLVIFKLLHILSKPTYKGTNYILNWF